MKEERTQVSKKENRNGQQAYKRKSATLVSKEM